MQYQLSSIRLRTIQSHLRSHKFQIDKHYHYQRMWPTLHYRVATAKTRNNVEPTRDLLRDFLVNFFPVSSSGLLLLHVARSGFLGFSFSLSTERRTFSPATLNCDL